MILPGAAAWWLPCTLRAPPRGYIEAGDPQFPRQWWQFNRTQPFLKVEHGGRNATNESRVQITTIYLMLLPGYPSGTCHTSRCGDGNFARRAAFSHYSSDARRVRASAFFAFKKDDGCNDLDAYFEKELADGRLQKGPGYADELCGTSWASTRRCKDVPATCESAM